MRKYHLSLNLQFFAEEGAGVESVSAAETQDTASESGVEAPAAAEPEKQNNFEKAFAKRLAEKEAEWKGQIEAERAKYKDYDTYKEVAEYFRQTNQAPDVMTLREHIEMQKLQEMAEQQNIPVEMLKRLQTLEQKAAEADQLRAERDEQEKIRTEQEQQQTQFKEFRTNLETFAKDNNVDADKLHQFMYDNQIGKFDAALKAMQYDELKQKLESAEKEGVKKFLSAKSKIPTVPSTNQAGQVVNAAPKTFAEARARAMQRLSSE